MTPTSLLPVAPEPALGDRPSAVVTDIGGSPFQAGAAADGSCDVSIEDWDTLFSAVKARLRQGADGVAHGRQDAPSVEINSPMEQCAEALDQLHMTMLHQIGRSRALEAQLFAAQSALTFLRGELADTQAGELATRHLATHDGLTSLPNRAGFQTRLARVLSTAAERGQVFALLYIDLDGFKNINDLHGHTAGDELLRIIASRMAGAVRAEDMVSRVGGDEFACLLWSPDRAALSRLAITLYNAVAAPFRNGSLSLTVHPSIGIAMWPADGLTADVLLRHADAAMYHAKRHRTGHAYFDQCKS